MAKLVVLLAIFAVFYCVTSAPAEKGNHCTYEGIKIPAGQSAFIPGKCMKATCSKDLSIQGTTCTTAQVGHGCTKSKYDYNKPYPDCCPKVTCS